MCIAGYVTYRIILTMVPIEVLDHVTYTKPNTN